MKELYEGDCRDVLPTLPTGSFDLILTDPPYGQDYESHRIKKTRKKSHIIMNDKSDETLALLREVLPQLPRLMKPDGTFLLFASATHYRVTHEIGKLILDLFPNVQVLGWNRVLLGMGNLDKGYRPVLDLIFFATMNGSYYWGGGRDVVNILDYQRVYNPTKTVGHPTPKPYELIGKLIELHCPPGGTILDPFAGSGITGIAAKRLGRSAVLIESKADYCRLISQSLSQELPLY